MSIPLITSGRPMNWVPDEEAIKRIHFIEKIRIDEQSGCWIWTASITNKGYGQFFYKGWMRKAHRVSAVLLAGFDLNSPLCVCHKCDNPPCVNPLHFFIGTQADNMRDAWKKKRTGLQSKPRYGSSLLTNEQVNEVRRRWNTGEGISSIAANLGVHYLIIFRIVKNISYQHVPIIP